MDSAHSDRQLGEYRLREFLSENPTSRTWLAEQISISRLVLLDELRSDQAVRKEDFLADIRAKAAVDHPLIGSVYEAVDEPEVCFYTHELLPGSPLTEGKTLAPKVIVSLLQRVSEAGLRHEALGQATALLDLSALYVDPQGGVRLKNLAIAGSRLPDQSARDITHLGNALPTLTAAGQPGATRVLTVLSWMRGDGLDAPITWQQIRDFCAEVEQQLAAPTPPLAPSAPSPRAAKKKPAALIGIVSSIVLIGLAVIALKLQSSRRPVRARIDLPEPVTIAAGSYATPDGTVEARKAFRLAAHEVTIGQYAAFLETLNILTESKRSRTFDSPTQPPEKANHEPTDWTALFAAAKAGGRWDNQAVTLDSPVVGVDWWDASAFAEWKQARLPSQEEWFAAVGKDTAPSLEPGPWLPVTSQVSDRTASGLLGMAGSVCEWTSKPAPSPTNPLGDRLWVIIGGSHSKRGSNALTREWTDNRSLRRPDLGFRLAFEVE